MPNQDAEHLSRILRAAQPLHGGPGDLNPPLALIDDASCVLIGEASHGTHDFYRVRAELPKRLIMEEGFTAIAVEADWPDAYRVNRYVHGSSADTDANAALADFKRFPGWMWRNADVLDFVGWLRAHNDLQPAPARVGFYGLDLYSMHTSIDAVLAYLDRSDPEAARRARERYACIENAGEDPQRYGYAASFGLTPVCEREVVDELIDLQRQRGRLSEHDGLVAQDEFFHAEQNARLVKNAERYYRAMFQGRVSSWNLRDEHMADTFEAPRLHRAIGVIYRPDTERVSHYFQTRLAQQYDGIFHLDQTRALEPLEPTEHRERGEDAPDTYPTGV